MKKLLLCTLAACALGAQAYADDFKRVEGRSFEGIFPAFCLDNQLLYLDDEEDDQTTFRVFDQEFSNIKTFSVPEKAYTYKYTSKTRKSEYVGILESESETVIGTEMSYDDAMNYIYNNYGYYDFSTEIPGGWRFVISCYGWSGEYLPTRYLDLVDGTLTYYEKNYSSITQLPVGDFVENEYEERVYVSYVELYPEDFTYDIDCQATISQTLFNKDGDLEYLVPLIETRSYTTQHTIKEWENIDYGFESYGDIICHESIYENKPVCVGFQVMNDKGVCMQTVHFPAGFTDYVYSEMDWDVLLVGGKRYLELDLDADNSNESATFLYEIKNDGSGVAAPMKFDRHVRVSPTDVRRSQNVDVTLDEPMNHDCKINVVNANGKIVRAMTMPAGATRTTINTSDFASGLYIVNVQDGESIRENCKIIVR